MSAGAAKTLPTLPDPGEEDASVEFRYPEVPLPGGLGLPGWPDGTGGAGEFSSGSTGNAEILRAAALQEGEERARACFREELEREREALHSALAAFAQERSRYFHNVERAAVQLSLMIARKVLEREARVDPLAVSAMVHVALSPLQAGTAVTLLVHPAAAQDWRLYFAAHQGVGKGRPSGEGVVPAIVEDDSLKQGECMVSTAMGIAEISLGQKLEEIEASFLELLAQRPGAPV